MEVPFGTFILPKLMSTKAILGNSATDGPPILRV